MKIKMQVQKEEMGKRQTSKRGMQPYHDLTLRDPDCGPDAFTGNLSYAMTDRDELQIQPGTLTGKVIEINVTAIESFFGRMMVRGSIVMDSLNKK